MIDYRYCLLVLSLISVQAQAYDLLEAWRGAVSQDPAFASARADANAGQTKHLQAIALKSPQLSLNASVAAINSDNQIRNAQFTNALFSGGGIGAKGTTDFRTKTDAGLDLNVNLRAEMPLYDVALTGTATQLNKLATLSDVQLKAESQQLILRVAQAYFDALFALDTLSTLKFQQKTVLEALDSAKARFKEGDAAIIDTHETQARYDILSSQVMGAESQVQLTRAILGDISGNQDAALAHIADTVDFNRYMSGDLQSWLNRAQTNSPQVQGQQLQTEIAQVESKKFQAQYSPIVNLVAQAGGEHIQGLSGSDADITNRQLSLGVQLTIPLYSSGMRDARYKEALALEDKAHSQVRVMKQKAAQEARASWMAVTVGLEQTKALEQARHSAELKLASTRLGRDVGDRTVLDALNAEHELYSTSLALFHSKYQMLQALLNLTATAGELDEAHLQAINQVFNQ